MQKRGSNPHLQAVRDAKKVQKNSAGTAAWTAKLENDRIPAKFQGAFFEQYVEEHGLLFQDRKGAKKKKGLEKRKKPRLQEMPPGQNQVPGPPVLKIPRVGTSHTNPW